MWISKHFLFLSLLLAKETLLQKDFMAYWIHGIQELYLAFETGPGMLVSYPTTGSTLLCSQIPDSTEVSAFIPTLLFENPDSS